MKALAARTRDIDDLRVLADIIGVDSRQPCRYVRSSIRMKLFRLDLPPSSTNSSTED